MLYSGTMSKGKRSVVESHSTKATRFSLARCSKSASRDLVVEIVKSMEMHHDCKGLNSHIVMIIICMLICEMQHCNCVVHFAHSLLRSFANRSWFRPLVHRNFAGERISWIFS
jgi:hypothetical protein